MSETIERPRIFNHITRSRFLHVEDALEIGKVRFFIGAYERGNGARETAYHFLDVEDARPLFADLGWSKAADFTDYKGSANGGQPTSRVLKIKGPKDGKYWLEIQNGPGEIIGQGAVKPAGQPDAAVSIALTTWEMRKLALAINEYLLAYRVAALIHPSPSSPPPSPPLPSHRNGDEQASEPVKATVERYAAAQDINDLFGPADPPVEQVTTAGQRLADQVSDEVKAAFNKPKAPQAPTEQADTPATFYALAPAAIQAGMLDLVNTLVQAPGPWSEKAAQLKAALA